MLAAQHCDESVYFSGRNQVVHFNGHLSIESLLTGEVLQGSVSGPKFFILYAVDVVRIAQSFGVYIHCHADDLQLYVHCCAADVAAAVVRFLACTEAIDKFMKSNRLKMNPEKTQFIWLGSRQQLSSINVTPLHLHDRTIVAPSVSVRNLGVIFGSMMTMAENVDSVTLVSFYQLRQLQFMRRCLPENT